VRAVSRDLIIWLPIKLTYSTYISEVVTDIS